MPIDILLPFWGDPDLLRTTVESVRAQTNPDWKLTVVDDAYPDETVGPWLEALDDARISYVRHETNVGITENYRSCLRLATEELLVFLGCDDLLHPNYVDVVLAAHAAHPEAAVIQPGVDIIDEHGAAISSMVDAVKQRLVMPSGEGRQLLEGEALATSLLHGNWLYWPSLVFRRDRITQFEFRSGLPIIQDLALIIDMTLAGDSLVLDPEVCFSYRRHTGSASATSIYSGKRFADDRTYFAIAAQLMRERGWKRAERAARMRLTSRAHSLSLLPGAILGGKRDALRPLLTHTFRP